VGGNVLVRLADGQAFLTDFGAGYYRSAATLTSKLLPPGTPAYRSPEAWGFLHLFLRHPTAHYPASPCDDLFALGVMAYRLVTDEYPQSTSPEEPGGEVWREGGPGPRPPRELNPRVSAKLDALILRLLATAPEERFRGLAREAAKALDRVAAGAGPEVDDPYFSWGHGRAPRLRALEAVRQAPLPLRVRVWGVEAPVAGLGLLLACLLVAWLHRWQGVTQHVCIGVCPDARREQEADGGTGKPPCKEEGKEEAYDWKGACYMPSYPIGREPTADPP
jgi:hypothetical protein